jgi:glyoxylase-like metal-dependent hydrolase (beta-lactamase superfamily II)
MVWDTGFAPGTSPNAPKVGIVDRLKELKITPEQVKYVGISFKTWIGEGRKVEPLTGDKDVFGDGSVIVLRMPGHTLGHSCLLVRLKDMGPVLLTGDLVHFRENYETGGVPSFNVDRAATVASIERMKQIVANLKATVIIQHDMRDIGKLPAFPAAAK